MKHSMRFLCLWIVVTCLAVPAYAEKLTIVVTGNAHAALFPSPTPAGKIGGVSKRNTIIKDIRKNERNVVVVDSGESFADEKTGVRPLSPQEAEQRSLLFSQSLSLGGYDACGVGIAELSFGADFLAKIQHESRVPYVAANLTLPGVVPFVLKDLGPFKVGIVGLAPEGSGARFKVRETVAEDALRSSIQKAKEQGVRVFIVLSQLSGERNKKILESFKDVSLVIGGTADPQQRFYRKIGDGYIVNPFAYGEKLIRIDMRINDGTVPAFSFNQMSIDAAIKDDRATAAILPACFVDTDCPEKEGWTGRCATAVGNEPAQCLYKEAKAVPVQIITDISDATQNESQFIAWLKKSIPGIKPEKVEYSSKKGQTLIRQYGITSLPAYLFDKAVEGESLFNTHKKFFLKQKNKYVIDPSLTGVFLFLDRDKKSNRIDVFLNLLDAQTADIFRFLREYKGPRKIFVHYILSEQNGQITAAGEAPEVDEALRMIAVQQLFPDRLWDYIGARYADIKSTWWDVPMRQNGIDVEAASSYARSKEASRILRDKIQLTDELRIVRGPVILIDNIRIYALQKSVGENLLKHILQR